MTRPMMICYYCAIDADLDPSYELLPNRAPKAERRFAVPISEYEHHCFVLHPRMATPATEEGRVRLARAAYQAQALASARPHGRCATSRTCVEHVADRSVPSCKRNRGRRVP